jgi:S-ribosylhomocysteine lyase
MNDAIRSFRINHERLKPGIYVSECGLFGDGFITTFALRFKRPNVEPPIEPAALHTITHLGNVFLRNHKDWGERLVYFGPMSCRTGFYMLVSGAYGEVTSVISDLVKELCEYIMAAEEIPGATAAECSNYLEHNLALAKYYIIRYHNDLIECLRTVYPE